MKRSLLSLSVFLGCIFAVVAQNQSAAGILIGMIEKVKNSPSISADFTIEEGGNKASGQIVMAGECFRIMASEGRYESWFDGKTQWTWTDVTGEVNMSEPTKDELLESNPLTVIESLSDYYRPSVLNKQGVLTTLLLKPVNTKSSNVKEAEIEINNSTNFPVGLTVKLSGSRTIAIRLSSIKQGPKLQSKEFKYNPSYHPGAQIIDLR